MAYVVGGGAELFGPVLGPIRQELHQEDIATSGVGVEETALRLSGHEDVATRIGGHAMAYVVGGGAELFDTKGNNGRPSAPSSTSASVFASASGTADDANHKKKPSDQGSG
jgi:hypothetical protein